MQTLTSLALGLEAMARVLEKYQVDAAVLFTAAGIDSQPYRDADARVPVAEWGGKPASCRQEEEAYVDTEGERHWVFRRQSRFHVVW